MPIIFEYWFSSGYDTKVSLPPKYCGYVMQWHSPDLEQGAKWAGSWARKESSAPGIQQHQPLRCKSPCGASPPCVNWRSHACYLYLCSDEGFPLERDMSTHTKPVSYLYHSFHLANMVQKGMAGADHEMSFFQDKIFTFIFLKSSRLLGFDNENPQFSSFLLLIFFSLAILSTLNRGQNIFIYWTILKKTSRNLSKYFYQKCVCGENFQLIAVYLTGKGILPGKNWQFLRTFFSPYTKTWLSDP